jgi:hypothetical protein
VALVENLSDPLARIILSRINGYSTAGSNTFGETARTGVEQGTAEKEHVGRLRGVEWSALLQHGHDMEPLVREQQHFWIAFVSLVYNDFSVRKGEIKTPLDEKRANTSIAPIYDCSAVIIYGCGNDFQKGWLP